MGNEAFGSKNMNMCLFAIGHGLVVIWLTFFVGWFGSAEMYFLHVAELLVQNQMKSSYSSNVKHLSNLLKGLQFSYSLSTP